MRSEYFGQRLIHSYVHCDHGHGCQHGYRYKYGLLFAWKMDWRHRVYVIGVTASLTDFSTYICHCCYATSRLTSWEAATHEAIIFFFISVYSWRPMKAFCWIFVSGVRVLLIYFLGRQDLLACHILYYNYIPLVY